MRCHCGNLASSSGLCYTCGYLEMLEHQKNRRRAEKQANERLEFDRQVERRREREFERREYPSSSSNTQRFVPINSTPEGAELKGNMLRKGYTEKQINDHFSSIDWQIQMGMGVSSVQAYHLNYIRFNYPKNKDSLTVKIFKSLINLLKRYNNYYFVSFVVLVVSNHI